MSGLNSKPFLSDKFYDSIVLLGRPIGCCRSQWRKKFFIFIKTSTLLSCGGILSTITLSVSIKDTVLRVSTLHQDKFISLPQVRSPLCVKKIKEF